MRDLITLLYCEPGKVAAKAFTFASGAWSKTSGYDAGYLFTTQVLGVAGIADLAAVLSALETRQDVIVIRGEPVPGFSPDPGRRISHDQPDGAKARFREPETGRHWFELDFDGVALPGPLGPEELVEYLISRLPTYLDASCFWQLSSSAGLSGPLEGRARLWFWSDRPIRDAELKTWVETIDPELRLDTSLFSPVQPHYVAAPILVGAPDPVPRRSGLRPGAPEVSIPVHVTPYAVGETFGAYERRMSYLGDGPGRGGFNDVIRGAIASWVGAGRGEFSALKNDVRARIDAAPKDPSRDVGRYKSDAYLDSSIAGAVAKFGKPVDAPIYEVLGVDRIFAPLTPIEYLIEALDIAPGAPTLIAGYGFSGKTAAVQQMALDLSRAESRGDWMNPRPVWGKFAGGRRCRVLHIDYEQGQLTLRRYQRLARAAGVTLEDLRGHLDVICFPKLYLDVPASIAALDRLCDGYDLVIFDSLKAASRDIEENSSDFRRPLDDLSAISEKRRCAMAVIHHARKPSQDKQGGAKMAIRGSGAIFDACSSVLVFEGEKGKPTQVAHEKARNSGITTDDFELVIEDVDGGLRVRAGDITVTTAEERMHAQTKDDMEKIRAYLAVHHRFTSRDELRAAMAVSTGRVGAAMGAMLTSGELIFDGSHKTRTYFLSGVGPETNGVHVAQEGAE